MPEKLVEKSYAEQVARIVSARPTRDYLRGTCETLAREADAWKAAAGR
jgi:hypothetical protein